MDSANSMASNSAESEDFLTRIVVKRDNTYHIVKITDVIFIEAAGNYITIVTASNKHLFRTTLSGIKKRLDPRLFVQIHRSSIVNIEYISKIKENAYGDCMVIMKSGEELKMSRNYKELLENF